MDTNYFMANCGCDLKFSDAEDYVLDLSECGVINAGTSIGLFKNTGFTKIIMGDISIKEPRLMFNGSRNLIEVDLSNMVNTGLQNMDNFASYCLKLTTLNIQNLDMSKVSYAESAFLGNSQMTNLKFGHGIKVNVLLYDSPLTHTSLMSVINNVGTANSGQVLRFGGTNLAKLSPEDRQIAIDKNWSLT